MNFVKKSLVNFVGKYWHFILITLLGLSVSWPLFKSGYFSHQDDLQIIRLFEMRQCFFDLQIPCRWVSNMGWGNGLPLFNFYSAFPYYLGAILSFVVGFIVSSKILFFLALVGGSFGMYLLVKELWGKYAGITSAILYLMAPYKALDIYVRGALSESMALALIPFVFYFFYKTITSVDKKGRYFTFSTISLFLFLVTHNIMTLVFLPVFFLWLFYWLVVTKWKRVKTIAMSLLLAFGLSAFFILPAFFEKDLVQTESLTRFELDYRANFVNIKQLFFDRVWGYGTSIPGPEGGMSFQIGWPHWLLVVVSLCSLFISKIKKRTKVLVLSVFTTFIMSVFMTHSKSTFIWGSIGILKYFQFPWRFLSLSIFSASMLGGVVVAIVKEKWQIYLGATIVLLTVFLNWSYFRPKEFFKINDRQKLTGELWDIQRSGAILDYLPKTALEPREEASVVPYIISGKAEVVSFDNYSNRWELKINVNEESIIEMPVYYFPNWEVTIDGEVYPSSHDNLLGRISITLDEGYYEVKGRLKNTNIRNFANLITLVSAFGLILWKKE